MLFSAVSRRPASLCRALSYIMVLTIFLSASGASPGHAHEGHDHGPPPPALPNTSKPRVAVHSDAYELVAVANGARLTLFLDQFADNAPVSDARIEILFGAHAFEAIPHSDGTYVAAITGLDRPGVHPLVFNINHPAGDDLLEGKLEIQSEDVVAGGLKVTPLAAIRDAPAYGISIGLAVLVGITMLMGGVLIGRLSGNRHGAAALVVFILALSSNDQSHAHEGHPPSPAPSAENLTGDAPRRLSDGSVFLPKPSQRLLTVRTQLAVKTEANRTVILPGRIIADPNRAGVVQSINGGRVAAPAGGFPRLGQRVRAGDILATVVPALPLADQSTLAEKARELEGQLLLNQQRLTRLNRLTTGNVPRSQIDDIELELTTTQRRLDSLRDSKVLPEVLVAPIDGVTSASRLVAGQVVQPQDILFQIVDPAGIWVEALAFDQREADAVVSATAQAGPGHRMTLAFEGRGRTLQQQAIVLQFSISDPPPDTVLGSPVTVFARKSAMLTGIVLPRDAVIRGSGGETIVWQHVDPERFVARQVRIEPFNGESVLITAGIEPGVRVVVHGAELLDQVR